MSDEEIVSHTKRFMKESGISGRSELAKADSGLYQALLKRELLDKAGFEDKKCKQRLWKEMSDKGLVAFAKRFMKEKRIRGRNELKKVDQGLYDVLRKRKLSERIGFEEKRRDWASMSDDELVTHAEKLIKEKGISGRGKLLRAESGLYKALLRRKLLDRVGFEEKRRDWASMSDKELMACARRFIKENNSCRTMFRKKLSGLSKALKQRGLFDKLDFRLVRRPNNLFIGMNNEELLEYARNVVEERSIKNRKQLGIRDSSLYKVLNERGLLCRVGFKKKQREQRKWMRLDDEELAAFARKFCDDNDVKRRVDLGKVDPGLYEVLRKRKLLDRVGFEDKLRNWSSLSDAQLVEHTRRFMEEKGIGGRKELRKADQGLYFTLRKRKLLDRAFSDVDQIKEREEAQALFDGLAEFGGAG